MKQSMVPDYFKGQTSYKVVSVLRTEFCHRNEAVVVNQLEQNNETKESATVAFNAPHQQ